MGPRGFGAPHGASSWDPDGSEATYGTSSWDADGSERSLLGVRRNSWVPDPLFDGLPGASRGRGGFGAVDSQESVGRGGPSGMRIRRAWGPFGHGGPPGRDRSSLPVPSTPGNVRPDDAGVGGKKRHHPLCAAGDVAR